MARDEDEFCEECGNQSLKKIGDVDMTKIFICTNCFAEKTTFVGYDKCKHEYNTHNECMYCGKKR